MCTRFRIVDMFSHCTNESVKNTILFRFKRQSSLRVVVATVAFGMGIDSRDVRQIIHWGVPQDAEMLTVCRKELLFINFSNCIKGDCNGCKWCDVCKKDCTCKDCK